MVVGGIMVSLPTGMVHILMTQQQIVSPRPCQHCGLEYIGPLYEIKNGLRKYCSSSCGWASHRRTGPKPPRNRPPERQAWDNLKSRCLNPAHPGYHRYGGRGITICDAWKNSYETFLADVGLRPSPAHSIDRIDNNRGYEPGNCRWSTRSEQGRNKRANHLLTFNGVTDCVAGWADRLGVTAKLLAGRLDLGWSVERTLTTPRQVAYTHPKT